MDKDITNNLKLLKAYRYRINKQQYRTFKGQILAGDIEGFRKGLFHLIKDKIMR